jgi:hypothetical protein
VRQGHEHHVARGQPVCVDVVEALAAGLQDRGAQRRMLAEQAHQFLTGVA